MATKITIEIEGCELKEIEEVNVQFRDNRPTTTFTKSRTDEEGNIITTTTISPYDETAPHERGGKSFGKK